MISFKNVSIVYENGCRALDNFNIDIKKGEFVFIVGPSGAGKSTFTKLIMREELPSDGEVYVNNVNVSNLKPKEVPYHRRNIGMVFQDFRLLGNKNVFENIAFAMRIVGATPKQIRRNVPNILNMVGLINKAKSLPHELSGGEQQRVSLARALINNPQILIADEPTGNLDPATTMEIMKLIEDINKRGTTVVVATHAREIVNEMKKRVVAIENGQVIRDDEKGVYGYED